MNHLFNISVYHQEDALAKARAFCDKGVYVDGLELLTAISLVSFPTVIFISLSSVPSGKTVSSRRQSP